MLLVALELRSVHGIRLEALKLAKLQTVVFQSDPGALSIGAEPG